MYDRGCKVETFLLKNEFNYLELKLENGEDATEEWNFGILLDEKTYFVVDEDKKEITPEEIIIAIDRLNELLKNLEK